MLTKSEIDATLEAAATEAGAVIVPYSVVMGPAGRWLRVTVAEPDANEGAHFEVATDAFGDHSAVMALARGMRQSLETLKRLA